MQTQLPTASWLGKPVAVILCVSFCCAGATQAHESLECVIEELTFNVSAEHVETFVCEDRRIWTAMLAEQKGFLGKSVWTSSEDKSYVRLIVYWRSRADWHAVPRSLLRQTEQSFAEAMPERSYGLVSSRAFRQRAPGAPAENRGTRVTLADFATEWHRLATNITIEQDLSYSKRKRYRALPLKLVIEKAFDLSTRDSAKTRLIFHCKDDYQASMRLVDALQSGGWLAIHDLDAPDNSSWSVVGKGSKQKSPAPYYVVWSEAKGSYENYPWPYGVTGLELIPD